MEREIHISPSASFGMQMHATTLGWDTKQNTSMLRSIHCPLTKESWIRRWLGGQRHG